MPKQRRKTLAQAELNGGPNFVTCAKKGKNWRSGTTTKKGTKVPSACVKKVRADKGKTRAQWRAFKANDPAWVKKELKKNRSAKSVNKQGELVY